jgi:hypothetical protein
MKLCKFLFFGLLFVQFINEIKTSLRNFKTYLKYLFS